jgi:hypothetical protein
LVLKVQNFAKVGEPVATYGTMTPEERNRMVELCAQIAGEKNARKFDELVMELNGLFEGKKDRLAVSGQGFDMST